MLWRRLAFVLFVVAELACGVVVVVIAVAFDGVLFGVLRRLLLLLLLSLFVFLAFSENFWRDVGVKKGNFLKFGWNLLFAFEYFEHF